MSRFVAAALFGVLLTRIALGEPPREAVSANERGIAHLLEGRAAEAIEAFDRAIEAQPSSRILERNLAASLAALAEDDLPGHVVVLDGTWFHARKIYQAHGWLRELPQLRLLPTEPSRYRVRREPKEGYVATIEAIFYALRILEPGTAGLDGLLRSFAAMVDRQASHMGLDAPLVRSGS